MRYLILILLAAVALAACGQSGVTQTNKTSRYTVELTVDSAKVGDRVLTLSVRDKSGAAAAVEQVLVAPVMRDMGMANPERAATQVAPGRYELRGEPLTMVGQWEFDVRIVAGGQEDTTTFLIPMS